MKNVIDSGNFDHKPLQAPFAFAFINYFKKIFPVCRWQEWKQAFSFDDRVARI
jgi:hypothetical protein